MVVVVGVNRASGIREIQRAVVMPARAGRRSTLGHDPGTTTGDVPIGCTSRASIAEGG